MPITLNSKEHYPRVGNYFLNLFHKKTKIASADFWYYQPVWLAQD